jgi:hypothetical protein
MSFSIILFLVNVFSVLVLDALVFSFLP